MIMNYFKSIRFYNSLSKTLRPKNNVFQKNENLDSAFKSKAKKYQKIIKHMWHIIPKSMKIVPQMF